MRQSWAKHRNLSNEASVLRRKKKNNNFVALDFETADYEPDSACAVALVRVENDRIVRQVHHLIKPPRKNIIFTYLHGITWQDVRGAPKFSEVWPTLTPMLKDIDFIAAHNATFDKTVLYSCCRAYRIDPPAIPFKCTVWLARNVWNIYPTKLPDVCRYLGRNYNFEENLGSGLAIILFI
jgi:DNA polymerase-3 subunit epsilon